MHQPLRGVAWQGHVTPTPLTNTNLHAPQTYWGLSVPGFPHFSMGVFAIGSQGERANARRSRLGRGDCLGTCNIGVAAKLQSGSAHVRLNPSLQRAAPAKTANDPPAAGGPGPLQWARQSPEIEPDLADPQRRPKSPKRSTSPQNSLTLRAKRTRRTPRYRPKSSKW